MVQRSTVAVCMLCKFYTNKVLTRRREDEFKRLFKSR